MTLMTFVYLIAGLVLLVAGAEVLVRGAAKLAAQSRKDDADSHCRLSQDRPHVRRRLQRNAGDRDRGE